MKHALRTLLIGLLFSLMLSSCSSLSDLVRSQVEGLPSWVYSPQTRSDQVAFVGQGSAAVAYNARLLAYEDILKQISEYVGEDVRSAYYRELTTTNAIADLKLTISSEHERTEGRFQNHVYLLARLDAGLLAGKRTSVYNEILKRDADIEELLKQADRSYRANDDTTTIRLYLEAAILAAQGPVNVKKHELPYLLEKAQTFISSLRMSLRDADPSKATVSVYVRRKSRLLSPKVLKASVTATFQARNSLGRSYTDFLQFNTTGDGFFSFVPYNQGLHKSGEVVFSLDFTDLRNRISSALDAQAIAPILAAMDECRIEFPYSIASPVAGRMVAAQIQAFNQQGALLPQGSALQSFSEELALDGIAVQQVSLGSVELEEQLAQLQTMYPQGALALLGTVGVLSTQQIQEKQVVVVSGRVRIHDLENQSVLYDTAEVEAVASGATLLEAREEAFRRFGSMASYLVRDFLFKR